MKRDNPELKFIVPKLLEQRGIATIDMMYGAKLSQGAAYHIARGDAKGLTFKTLGLLCNFFECQPSDLFEWSIQAKDKPD